MAASHGRAGWWPKPPLKCGDWEFTSILFGRPLAALLLYPLRNVISPNLVTFVSLLMALAAIPLLLFTQQLIVALVLLFVSMVLDDGDGLVARYQGKSSLFGSFWDKGADVIRFGLLFPALGYMAFRTSGNPLHLFLGALAPFGLMVQGYTKWLYEAHAAKKPGKSATAHEKPDSVLKGIAVALLWPFHECDLTLWIIILIPLGEWGLLLHILCWSQIIAGLLSLIVRTVSIISLDRSANG